jgi:DNA-binding NtrC family response regulator
MPRILIIDDEADFSDRLCRCLKTEFEVTCLHEADAAALERLAAGEFALVLLDNGLPKVSGVEFLESLEQRDISVPVILVSHAADPQVIIAAKKRGAFAYVQKQTISELVKTLRPKIHEALEIWSQQPPVALPGEAKGGVANGPQLDSLCPKLQKVYEQIGQATTSNQPVLILGEAGTGKDLVARAIHDNSPREKKAFVVVRCNTFNDDFLRDELFGHEVNFRGEGQLRKGKLEHAGGGTLYLDEVGELPLSMQDEMLRVLEELQITRLGGNEPVPVDVRVLASSRRDLHAIPGSTFRRELLDHLTGEIIRLPRLSDRLVDLESLAGQILAKEAERAGMSRVPRLHRSCHAKLRSHPWPGNIRELQLVLRRALLHRRGPQILPEDLTFKEQGAEARMVAGLHLAISSALASDKNHLYGLLLDMLKKELPALTLQECGGDTREAERRLGVSLRDIIASENPMLQSEEVPTPKRFKRQSEALLLIRTYPDWTVKQFAEKLKCSTATLYRDEYISRALEARKADRRLPHGYKRGDGSIEAFDTDDE